jgi:hypothetical protein
MVDMVGLEPKTSRSGFQYYAARPLFSGRFEFFFGIDSFVAIISNNR